jgi:hypothetical protein
VTNKPNGAGRDGDKPGVCPPWIYANILSKERKYILTPKNLEHSLWRHLCFTIETNNSRPMCKSILKWLEPKFLSKLFGCCLLDKLRVEPMNTSLSSFVCWKRRTWRLREHSSSLGIGHQVLLLDRLCVMRIVKCFKPEIRLNNISSQFLPHRKHFFSITKANRLILISEIITNQLPGAESFLWSRQSLSYSRISPYFIEPEGLLPCSQEPATEPDESTPRHPILFL